MKYFNQNKISVGIVAMLLSGLLPAAILYIVLMVMGIPAIEKIKWFGGAYIPMILVLRHYAKAQQYPTTTKSCIVVFFVTFIAFMAYLISNKII